MSTHQGMIGVSNITNRTDPNSLKSRVFVGNLNTVHMTKGELESVFSKYGAIIGISVHKGYAFIQYANENSARSAVHGEDSKVYYNMALDVTIASEPKNRKRGRSNVKLSTPNQGLLNWSNLASPGIPDLTLQAQALSNLANTQVLSSLQQLGLEGLMGQPNFAQFAAAANSVLSGAGQHFTGLNLLNTPTSGPATSRSKQTRLSGSQNSSFLSTSVSHSSSSAKRTRLDGMNQLGHSSSNALPVGARGQNLVSLVSPTDITGTGMGSHSSSKSSQGKQVGGAGKRSSPNYPVVSSHCVTTPNRATHTASNANRSSKTHDSSGIGQKSSSPSTAPPCSNQTLEKPAVAMQNTTESSGSARTVSEDILICGSCHRLFDHVDELISHKMAGCSLSHYTCETCRCHANEPMIIECAYCGANFSSAWDLVLHCHNEHGLTIYALPSPDVSPKPSSECTTSSIIGRTTDSAIVRASSICETKAGRLTADTNTQHQPILTSSARGEGHGGSDWEADGDTFGEVIDESRSTAEDGGAEGPGDASSTACSPHSSCDEKEIENDINAPLSQRSPIDSPSPSEGHLQYGGHRNDEADLEEDENDDNVRVCVSRSD